MDLAHLDEAGFAMTLPTTGSWFVRGQRLKVAYEAPQGRRVNVIGAHFTHGPMAGRLVAQSWASLPKAPKSRAGKTQDPRRPRRTAAEIAAAHGLRVEEVGPIDGARLLDFVWRVAGRPPQAPLNWRRERPLVLVLDNYSVHKSQLVEAALPQLTAAGIHLFYLPAYCPQLSGIEPVWNDVKQHHLPTRSFERVAALKQAVDEALARKSVQLWQAQGKSTNLQRLPT